jgi:hypothetical protein
MRAAAAMRVEIKDEHGAGACVERRTGGEDKTIERMNPAPRARRAW